MHVVMLMDHDRVSRYRIGIFYGKITY